MSLKKTIYTWEAFDKDTRKVAVWARKRNIKNIYGIPRGGLVVAVKLSHLLDIPLVLNRDDISKNTLIVDDIIDEGNTLDRLLKSIGKHPHIASLYYNKEALHAPHFFAQEKKGWVVFPWETKKTSRYDQTV